MKIKADKRLYIMVAIIAIALIGVFAVAVFCTVNMRRAIDKQISANLEDVADQTDSAIEKRIELYVDLLNNLLVMYEEQEDEMEAAGATEEEIKASIVNLHSYATVNGLLRVAFCDENGNAYGSDYGVGKNLSDREFFIRGKDGKSTITERLTDRLAPEGVQVNIITVPWYEDDGVTFRGVFGITFYSERMVELLQVDAFDGEGGSFAVNESGIIVIDARNAENKADYLTTKTTLVDVLKKDEHNDEETVDAIEEQLKSSDSFYGYSYVDGIEYMYYKKSITFDFLGGTEPVEWHIFTIVSMSYVNERFNVINMDFYMLIAVFMGIFLISIVALMVLARRHRNMVEKVAYVDSVTGGDSYAMYIRHLKSLKLKCGTFVSMDMVEFNSVRVAVGASEGDNILRAVNTRAQSLLGENEFIAHTGTDNFAMFLATTDSELLNHRIREFSAALLNLSHELNVPHLRMRCGLYVARYFTNETIDECCNRAGQAREVARKKNRMFWLYSKEDNDQMVYERELAGYFPDAIEREEFEVWYQPKYSVRTGKIVGAEALVRWRRDGQLISPGKFIPLFESNGMIAKLDEYMFRSVCRQQKLREAAGKRVVPVSVNLSRATMFNDGITDKYMGILKVYGVNVQHVQIEITESAVIGKDDLTAMLKKFRDMGEHILLDDFGTGYSSLSMLGLKCFDTLKIDKSLVDNIGSEDGKTLISSIVHMAHKLDMSVTAEGVENVEQYEELYALNCDAIQGFYFSRPLPMEKFEELLDSET